MTDYSSLGLDKNLRSNSSLTNGTNNYQTALEYNLAVEPTPYLHRTSVLNRGGTVQTNLGAIVDFKDLTGGTSLFTYNPTTGAITVNGPLILNGTTNIPNVGTIGTLVVSGVGTFTGPVVFNNQGTINNRSLIFTGGTTEGTSAIRMFNSGGTERITLGITSTGFGFGTVDEIQFKTNTSNKINESFGVRVELSDSVGAHAFRVRNSGGTERFALTSQGFMEVKGTQADPGGGGAGVARIFVQNAGGKDQLRVEFNTGTSVVIGAEP